MAYNDDRGCGMTTDKDVRVARAWTAFSVLTVSAGTVAGWFAEEWIWKATALAVPVVMLMMIHFAGAVTWRYQKQNPGMAYYGGQIQYIDAGAPPVVYSAVANSDDPPAQNVSVPESIPKPSSEEDAIEV
jgi:hypothetical protein